MTFDTIIADLKSTGATPKAALVAAVAHADALAPVVLGLVDKFCSGIFLLPADNHLLFYGLNVLAAAKHPHLLEQVLRIARQPAEDIHQLFPEFIIPGLTRVLLTVWVRSADELMPLIEHADMVPEVKWSLYDVLARLTFDGRIPHEQTTAFLARIEQDDLIDDGDMTWWGWESAVVKLGLTTLEPALHRVWEKVIFDQHDENAHAETLRNLRRAAEDIMDPSPFDEADIRPIDNPVEAVAWVAHRSAAMAKWDHDHAHERGPDTDVARAARLTEEEQQWLAGFLSSRQVPTTTMPFEMLDGLLTALVIGPEVVPTSEYLPVIWGTDDGSGPAWDSTEQAQYFFDLLMKHWNAIAARRSADAAHAPLIEHFGEAVPGEHWASGFAMGIDLSKAAWEPMLADRRSDQIIWPILALSGDAPEDVLDQMSPDARASIIERLPKLLQLIAAYWRNPERKFSRQEPVRSAKVGRNEPCPCGSGLKFKRCCGRTPPTALH